MLDPQAGHLGHLQELRRLDPAMAGEDPVLPVDQHRVGEAEGPDRPCDLPHLLAGMGTGVLRPGGELRDLDLLDTAAHGSLLLMFGRGTCGPASPREVCALRTLFISSIVAAVL